MVCAALFPFLSSEYTFTPADYDGARNAEHQLILWLLRSDLVKYCYFFPQASSPRHAEAAHYAITALPVELRSKVRIADILALDVNETRDLVFLSNVPDFHKLSSFRRVLGVHFPICSLVHSVVHPGLLDSYLSILVGSESSDVLVAFSTTAQSAVESVITQTRDVLREATGLSDCTKVPGPSVLLLPLGVDDALLQVVDRREARAVLGIPQDAEVVLYLGRLSESYKGDLEPLIRAFSYLAPRYPHAALIIAGQDVSGAYKRSLEELSRVLELNSSVRFIINFPPYAKRLIYSAADIFVSPADNIQESFGIAILEAMASGLPVVASNWSGYRDLVIEGETGFLVATCTAPLAAAAAGKLATLAPTPAPEHYVSARTIVDVQMLAQKLECLLGSADLRRAFGTAAQRRIQAQYCWSVVAPQYVALWEEQLRIARALPLTRRKYLKYDEFLNLYPSDVFEAESTLLGCSTEALVSFMRQYGKRDPRLSLLQHCNSSPRSFAELTAFQNKEQQRMAADVVIGLLKKGILEVRSGFGTVGSTARH